MYVLHVSPITGAKWVSSSLTKGGLIETDSVHIGASGRSKAELSGRSRGHLLEFEER